MLVQGLEVWRLASTKEKKCPFNNFKVVSLICFVFLPGLLATCNPTLKKHHLGFVKSWRLCKLTYHKLSKLKLFHQATCIYFFARIHTAVISPLLHRCVLV